jgi:hypothetical protein
MPIPLRPDFDAMRLRGLARESKDAKQVRRLLALAAIYGEAIRTEAARIGGVTLQIIRDWVLKFNARPRRPDRRQSAWSAIAAHRLTSCGAGRSRRERTDPGCPRRRALAYHRPLPVAVGGVSGQRVQANARPRTAGDVLPQAVSTPTPSRPDRGCDRGI